MSFLQTYDLKFVGGIDRVLQTAAEIAKSRQLQTVAAQSSALSLKSRFNFWVSANTQISNGFQETSINPSPPEVQNKSRPNSLASQITDTVWRGITNQTAMEDENPSPPASDSPVETQSQVQSRKKQERHHQLPTSGITQRRSKTRMLLLRCPKSALIGAPKEFLAVGGPQRLPR
jgi:hypothetical protein